VEGAEAENEVNAIDTNDLAIREELLESIEGDAVGRVVEDGYQYYRIGDIEIGVGGREGLPVIDHRIGHGEGDDAEGAAVEIAGAAEEAEVFLEGFVVGAGGVVFDGEGDGIGACEAGEVVDMAVGVIAGDAAVEPEGARNAEPAFEEGFILFAAEAGIAFLDRAEEALFGGEEEALAVDVDGAAFKDDAATVPEGVFGLEAGGAGGEFAGAVVAGPVVVLGPAVEVEFDGGAGGVGAVDEEGAEVAGPTAVGGGVDEGDTVVPGAGLTEEGAGLGAKVAGDENADEFVAGEDADDFAVEVGDGFEFTWPVGGFVGPGEPGGSVGFPFGGEAEGGGHGRVLQRSVMEE
jgi:hypothetical protein